MPVSSLKSSPRETLSFLPIADYGRFIKKFDPRTVFIMIGQDGKLYSPQFIEMQSSSIQWLDGEKALTEQQFEGKLKQQIIKYGNDIPLLVYADKKATIRSLSKFFQVCRNQGVYWIKFCALKPKWDGIYYFPVDLVDKQDLNQAKSPILRIELNNQRWKLEDKLYTKKELDMQLSIIGENDPDQPILLKWSKSATVQDLVSVLSLLKYNDLNKISLPVQRNK